MSTETGNRFERKSIHRLLPFCSSILRFLAEEKGLPSLHPGLCARKSAFAIFTDFKLGEKVVGEATKGRKNNLFIATKKEL